MKRADFLFCAQNQFSPSNFQIPAAMYDYRVVQGTTLDQGRWLQGSPWRGDPRVVECRVCTTSGSGALRLITRETWKIKTFMTVDPAESSEVQLCSQGHPQIIPRTSAVHFRSSTARAGSTHSGPSWLPLPSFSASSPRLLPQFHHWQGGAGERDLNWGWRHLSSSSDLRQVPDVFPSPSLSVG